MLLDPANKQHYDIMSAIRGPDNTEPAEGINGYWLKLAFTAPLRTLVGVPEQQVHAFTGWGWWNEFQATPWKRAKLEELQREAKSAGNHFLNHLAMAWRAASNIGICPYGDAMATCVEAIRPNQEKGMVAERFFLNVLHARQPEVPDVL